MSSPAHHRAHLAAVTRHHPDRRDLADAARRDLAAANLEAYIQRTVAKLAESPLTEDQRARLALLLRGPSGSGGAAA